MRKDPDKKRDRPEPQLAAHRAADPERASLAELRRKHGRDLADWPPEDRERLERWEATQLAAKAERARRDRTVTVHVQGDARESAKSLRRALGTYGLDEVDRG